MNTSFSCMHKNFLSNSVEQFLAAFVSVVVLSSYLGNVEQFKMIRCFQSILSWPESSSALIGYAIHEDYRGVGMVMTYFQPSVLRLLMSILSAPRALYLQLETSLPPCLPHSPTAVNGDRERNSSWLSYPKLLIYGKQAMYSTQLKLYIYFLQISTIQCTHAPNKLVCIWLKIIAFKIERWEV